MLCGLAVGSRLRVFSYFEYVFFGVIDPMEMRFVKGFANDQERPRLQVDATHRSGSDRSTRSFLLTSLSRVRPAGSRPLLDR